MKKSLQGVKKLVIFIDFSGRDQSVKISKLLKIKRVSIHYGELRELFMKSTLILFLSLVSLNAFAGGDLATVTVCKNQLYNLKIKRKGSFLGKNHYKLKENKFFGETLVDEDYDQDWSPSGEYEAEQMARKEYKGRLDFYLLLLSENAVLVQTYDSGSGYVGTYVQLKNSNEIIKFAGKECARE